MFFYLILSCANKKTDVCMKSSIVCIIGLTLFTLIADVVQASQEVVDAARAESLEEVRTLIESGADTNLPQGDGATALHWAVYWENSEMVDLLLAHNVDVDVANDLGVTPLFMACQAGNNSLVEKLLLAGADPNSSVPSGETPLMTASRAGSSMAVHQLLEHGAHVNARESTRGQTALMWAVANKHSGVVAKLLENDADVHARSEVRTRVYNMGGSRSAGSASAGIPLKEVAIGGSTAILFAARSGDIRSAELLLNAGADANDTMADGNTVLVIAAHSGHGSLVKFLLERGVDPNVAPLGYTALHAAVLRGDLRDRGRDNQDPVKGTVLVKELLKHGADPNARVIEPTPVRRWSHDFALMNRWLGATPYWLAAKFLETDMMKVLVDAGADVDQPSLNGMTPLMVAAGLGYRRGGGSAFITDRRDFSSYNPVASAELGSRIPFLEERLTHQTVELALELGGDVKAVSSTGDTALHGAATHGMNSVIQLLVEHGADIHAKNQRGQAPVALAVYREGIAGENLVREDTAGLLRELDPTRHLSAPHDHPEARLLRNPVASSEESINAGSVVYENTCARCHGDRGAGDGPLASGTAAYGARPSNLVDQVWQHGSSDGEQFSVIREGIGPDFVMDAYRGVIPDEDIWNVVNYLRSLEIK